MKTAISMPDDLFRRAEAAARRLRVSRSELYAKAIAEFLEGQQGKAITERLTTCLVHYFFKFEVWLGVEEPQKQ
jgi:metal-responsive CopG/Arc/MetJ family transcriptional regulator